MKKELNEDLSMDMRAEMIQINNRQKNFYESRFEALANNTPYAEKSANKLTNIWTRMRRKSQQMLALIGVEDRLLALHRQWMCDLKSDLKDATVLDLGCFSGNKLSLWIAENCASYTGIDLSSHAISILNAKLQQKGITWGHAYAQDFLTNSFADQQFDLIYAYSVLHHFKDMPVLLNELNRILKPGGVIISVDPLQTDPLNRIARAAYRPFQSDRDWEHPFTLSSLKLLQQFFQIEAIQGFQGLVKIGYPLLSFPGLNVLGKRLSMLGFAFDNRFATKLGLPLYLCWNTTIKWVKPGNAKKDRS